MKSHLWPFLASDVCVFPACRGCFTEVALSRDVTLGRDQELRDLDFTVECYQCKMLMEREARAASSFGVTGARTGGEPSGAHLDHQAQSVKETGGGPGRYTNTGHGSGRTRAQRLSPAEIAIESYEAAIFLGTFFMAVCARNQLSLNSSA